MDPWRSSVTFRSSQRLSGVNLLSPSVLGNINLRSTPCHTTLVRYRSTEVIDSHLREHQISYAVLSSQHITILIPVPPKGPAYILLITTSPQASYVEWAT
ncbi:hypothetical protein LshimejAT787_1702390 [Lyophyllum shimeji]|uniref:Uncharacterized protein n=1 Tax=Lyophyllum shimeji TaxID=47721 RepID=A0A9P3Q0H5_LYOSH|nr:hypothetical protein LshimejAT787_1702390 [Lyophyllum shimeji]